MGFISAVKGLISRLGKRKADDSETEAGSSSDTGGKRFKRYDLTPLEKFTPRNIEHHRSIAQSYFMGEVILTTENRNYEFKSGGMLLDSKSLPELINKYGSAFLNSEGGVLLAGVLDDGVVRGISVSRQLQMKLLRDIEDTFDQFRPEVKRELYSVKFVPVLSKRTRYAFLDIYVIEIRVRKGETSEIYESKDHQVFIRRDGGVQGPLRPIAIKDLAISKSKQAAREKETKLRENQLVKDLTKDVDYC